jgi:hypothetical protein
MPLIIEQFRALENKVPGALSVYQICSVTTFLDECGYLSRDLEFTQFATKILEKVYL